MQTKWDVNLLVMLLGPVLHALISAIAKHSFCNVLLNMKKRCGDGMIEQQSPADSSDRDHETGSRYVCASIGTSIVEQVYMVQLRW